ncbi:anthranilate phosphoribosyltransferase [Paenibacillus massiliensis]|uniref:anthranilate phosphoribosyltransferase n=1 Tax=Paenibacillus massiliensis TaxID=225917 RepID=UPI0004291F22|nr:anthranilate phosphoribosyltransferase [Paenibacillus massiliensis]
MNMIDVLKEVGRGKRGARDLTYEEALQAAEHILGGTATPAQIGAFLAAERIKMESVEELEAFVLTCRKYAQRPALQQGIDFAGPYDGRVSSFIATFPTAFLLAAAGLPVTLHGTSPLPPKWGITLSILLKELGIHPEQAANELMARAAVTSGVTYMHAEAWCQPLKRLRSIRVELGLRTVLNTMEKLVDYNHSPYIVFGVFHNTVFERTAKLLNRLNYQSALIIQGVEGSEDLHINRPTRTYRLDAGHTTMEVIDPEMFGLEAELPEMTWTPAAQIRVTEEVLRGEGHMAFMNQVLLNGAVRLHVAGRVDSIEEGIYTCKLLLENGEAWRTYTGWRSVMQESLQAEAPSSSR